MARIITVYNTERRAAQQFDMSYIRWFRMSRELARLGHDVDIATAEHKWKLRKPVVAMEERLRRVPLRHVRWHEYDVVKTLFHQGWETLRRFGGHEHPFIIAKLGSVVGPRDMDGIYFYGRARERMYETQGAINETARYVTVLSKPAARLWRECFGPRELLLVPGAVDRDIPPPGPDPYGNAPRPRVLFSGNLYGRSQPEANRSLVDKLNHVGRRLAERGIRLFVLGPGDVRRLDSSCVTHMGAVPYEKSWDWMHHADVGLLVSAGLFMHNNESTKIYHYLRAGLPVVSEAGFPNDWVLRESGLAFTEPSGSLDSVADRIVEATQRSWDRTGAIEYILANHTWDRRALIYDRLLRSGRPEPDPARARGTAE